MADGFKIDTKQFDKALVIYSQAVQKDASYVVNRTALNVAIKAAQATPLADKSAIESVVKRPWWPKFISKRLKKSKGRFKRADARKLSRNIVKQRIRVMGYIRSGWIPAIKVLNVLKLVARGRANSPRIDNVRQFKNPQGFAEPAKPGFHVTSVIANATPGAAQHPEFLQKGLDHAAEDMMAYAHKLMSETATNHSAK